MRDKKVMAGGALLLGAAGFWFVLKPEFVDQAPPPDYTEEEIAAAPKPTIEMEELVLNLRAPASDPAYVKIELAIEFADPNNHYVGLAPADVQSRNESFAGDLQPQMPRIRDAITAVVGDATPEEVSTPEGRNELKDELVSALNDRIDEERVTDVYFVTFITQ